MVKEPISNSTVSVAKTKRNTPPGCSLLCLRHIVRAHRCSGNIALSCWGSTFPGASSCAVLGDTDSLPHCWRSEQAGLCYKSAGKGSWSNMSFCTCCSVLFLFCFVFLQSTEHILRASPPPVNHETRSHHMIEHFTVWTVEKTSRREQLRTYLLLITKVINRILIYWPLMSQPASGVPDRLILCLINNNQEV